jgi:P-type conjugative transfer protein TrbJ
MAWFKKVLGGVTVWAAFAAGANAGAVIGATEPTQILNNIQLVMSYAQQAQQTVTQINQYETMLRNLQNLNPNALVNGQAQVLWNNANMNQAFMNLQTVVVNGQSTAYTLQNQNQLFQQAHPNYFSGNASASNLNSQYSAWSANTQNAIQNSLNLVGAHASNFANEQQLIQQLQTRSQTATGQLQVLQAGNDVGVAMVGQMQELRQLQMAQINAQGQYMSGQQSKDDLKESLSEKMFPNTTTIRSAQSLSSGSQ